MALSSIIVLPRVPAPPRSLGASPPCPWHDTSRSSLTPLRAPLPRAPRPVACRSPWSHALSSHEATQVPSYTACHGILPRRDARPWTAVLPRRIHPMRTCPSLGACVFSPEGYSGVGGAGCRAARTSVGSFPGHGRENALRRGRTRERQGPSQVCVAPCAAHHAAPPYIRGGAAVSVQVVKTEITPQLASADGLRGAETAPLPYGELLHTRR
jgi:hypothetical protein